MTAMENKARERALLEQATGQLGLLHRNHLDHAGLTQGAISARVAYGRLTRMHEDVFAWGHTAVRDEARWLAAQWSVGRDTALSHLTAGAYYDWRVQAEDEDVHLSTTRSLGNRDGITVHRTTRLERADLFRPRLFVVTSMPRTLVDLADVLTWPEYRALADGTQLRTDHIRAAWERNRYRAGSPFVRRLLEADEAHTKSEFERRYLRFARARGLPRPPGLNVWVAGHQADCVYGHERLVIELDGRAFHRRRGQMRADRQRDTDYQLGGYLIVRLVWDDLHPDEAARTADRIRRMLAAGAARTEA